MRVWGGLALAAIACVAADAQIESTVRDRVAALSETLSSRPLDRDPQTGYLRALLRRLEIPLESQLLVFSKTGVQHAFTGPRTPRALYFDESVVVGYVPAAPAVEIIAHDPVEGVAFYTLDQQADAPRPVRQRSCLGCHESASTRDVPGFIVRSHTVDDAGNVLARPMTPISHDVTHATGHPERWGGWLVTLEGTAPPYAQRAHQGNITFTPEGNTSSGVFVEWMASAPEARGYPSAMSDIVALLAFDHQMPAINLMTRLNFTARRAAAEARSGPADREVDALAAELAAYLLFADEAAMPVPLTPRAGFAKALAARTPHDPRGRSLAQIDGEVRLLRYPCSYMIYSSAFEALPAAVRQNVYRRMIAILTGPADKRFERTSAADRLAVLEILRATKQDFPAAGSTH